MVSALGLVLAAHDLPSLPSHAHVTLAGRPALLRPGLCWVCLFRHCSPHELSQEMWVAGGPEDAASRFRPCPRQKPLPPDSPSDVLSAFWSPDLSNSAPCSYLLERPCFPIDCSPGQTAPS